MNTASRFSRTCVGALAMALALMVLSASAASAGPVAIRATGSIVGSDLQGTVSFVNRANTETTVGAISTMVEMQLPLSVPSSFPPGTRNGYWRVAEIEISLPGPLAARQTLDVPYLLSLCGLGDLSGARSLRLVVVADAAGRVVRARSKRIAPPGTIVCTECGNGVVETGEQCDGGPCCTASCTFVADGTSCSDGDACSSTDVCSAGSCGGSPVSCDDGDECSTDSCDSSTGCSHTPIPGCAGCDEASCNGCKRQCAVEPNCESNCWTGFFSCLNHCTTQTYCAPFCQVDLGRCIDFCPRADPACPDTCESTYGCAAGCVAP